MSDHPAPNMLDAYHDGELPPVERAAIEGHLAGCDACIAKLNAIKAISETFAIAAVPGLSQISLHRLHANLDLLTDRGLLRIARILTGLAACVVLAGSLWLLRSNESPTPITSPVSLVLQLEDPSSATADAGPSDWMAAELSY
jgi:hypothetical protein